MRLNCRLISICATWPLNMVVVSKRSENAEHTSTFSHRYYEGLTVPPSKLLLRKSPMITEVPKPCKGRGCCEDRKLRFVAFYIDAGNAQWVSRKAEFENVRNRKLLLPEVP